jgi:hypothetical protein
MRTFFDAMIELCFYFQSFCEYLLMVFCDLGEWSIGRRYWLNGEDVLHMIGRVVCQDDVIREYTTPTTHRLSIYIPPTRVVNQYICL